MNGRLHVTLPSDANAEVEASTVSGNISNDFGLTVDRHQYVGHSLHGQLGSRRSAGQTFECEWDDPDQPRQR